VLREGLTSHDAVLVCKSRWCKRVSEGCRLQDVARISVLHASFVDYLLALSAERYAVLAKFPDFTTAVS
jgi:hypothetical protein